MTRFKSTGLSALWITVLLIGIDRFSKIAVLDHFSFYEAHPVTPFLNLTLAANTGAAFSFLDAASGWQNWFLGGLAVFISCAVLVWLGKLTKQARWQVTALCLILAGALGNAWDRVLYGFVVDFLSFHVGDWYFAIFNVADAAVTVGAIMLILSWVASPKTANGYSPK